MRIAHHQSKSLFAIVFAGLSCGCSDLALPRTVSGVVSGWSSLGAKLPSKEDIAFIQDRLPDSLAALKAGLADEDGHVRMSSAYVVEKLGLKANSLSPYMLERLGSEPKFINRVYLASALAEVGQLDPAGVTQLEICFRSETNEQVKTEIAGALVRLCSVEEQPDAWHWLLASLQAFPPDPPEERDARYDFWERRWSAAKHVRAVQGEEDVLLPLLRALASNPKTPAWVISQQVSETLGELESRVTRKTD